VIIFLDTPISPGVELRLLRTEHAAELFSVIERNRAHLRRWLPWLDSVKTVEDELNFLKRCEQQVADDVAFSCGIFRDGSIVGGIGIHPIDRANRKTEIGYWLDADHQGKGLMTSACRVLVGHLFSKLELNRVIIYCAAENLRSRAIPQRLGFQLEGIHRQAEWLYDHFVDLAWYAMLASQWIECGHLQMTCVK
jgi:ribosomal-protein-serine acetyltransferase